MRENGDGSKIDVEDGHALTLFFGAGGRGEFLELPAEGADGGALLLPTFCCRFRPSASPNRDAPSLYEAAALDGANRWHRMWHVTLPGILTMEEYPATSGVTLSPCGPSERTIYGLKYTSDGSATGTGTFTFDQELYDYMHGEYVSYSEQRATELEEGAFSSLERDFTTYHGQWAATLSDWEWLLDVMQAARAGLGYTQGYPMSMYQSGYISTGNLVSSFGGSGVEWQTDETSENVVFGADGPAFKTYVETMNEWYANGWIDPNFQTNEELFWRSDENTVRQGYVGLYLGMNDQLFDGMDMGTPTTEGIYVEGMPYPINDKYGTPEQQYVKPYTFYCM